MSPSTQKIMGVGIYATVATLAIVAYRHAYIASEGLYEARHIAMGALLESENYGVITLDDDQNITSWNPAVEKLTGKAEADVVGKPVAGMICEEFRDSLRESFADSSDGLKKIRITKCTLAGSSIEVRCRIYVVRKHGQRYGFILIDRNKLVEVTEAAS